MSPENEDRAREIEETMRDRSHYAGHNDGSDDADEIHYPENLPPAQHVHTPHHGPTDKVCHPTVSEQIASATIPTSQEDDGTLRTFASGATRDTSDGKPEHWGFSSALVEKRYGEYMHSKRIQTDGKLRDSNNWKKGIPQWAYFHSLSRHTSDLKLIAEGFPGEANEPDMEVVLCAMLFNVQGLLHEVLKENMVHGNPAKGERK